MLGGDLPVRWSMDAAEHDARIHSLRKKSLLKSYIRPFTRTYVPWYSERKRE